MLSRKLGEAAGSSAITLVESSAIPLATKPLIWGRVTDHASVKGIVGGVQGTSLSVRVPTFVINAVMHTFRLLAFDQHCHGTV